MNEQLHKQGSPSAPLWKTRRTFAASVLLCFSFFSGLPLLFAQEGVQAEPDTTAGPAIPSSYGSYPLAETTAAIALAREPGFNQGLISGPAQLFQGKLAGVQVYNRGATPTFGA